MKQKRIPKTNNAGDIPAKRSKMRSKDILSDPRYYFKGSVIKAMALMKLPNFNNYEEFVLRYVEERDKIKHQMYAPSDKELRIFEAYQSGEMSLDEFCHSLKLKTRSSAYQRIGRYYEFTRKQK